MKRSSLALVGVGGYGEQYLTHLLDNRPGRTTEPSTGVRLVAGVDAFPDRARMSGRLLAEGIPIYADLDACLREQTPDLVVIAAPIHSHVPLAKKALAAGSNLLCEKPLCAIEEEGRLLVEAARAAAGKVFAVGYQWSFSDAIGRLKRDILDGTFGAPLEMKSLVLWPRSAAYYARNGWAGRIRTDGGDWVLDSPLNNAAAHFLHNMLFLCGAEADAAALPTQVEAELFRANPIENFDTAALRVITENGVPVRMYTSHAVRTERGPLFELRFEKATVTFGADKQIVAALADGRNFTYGNPDTEPFAKLRRTVEAVQGGSPVPCGPETAMAHTVCVNRVQKLGIADFPIARIRSERIGSDVLTWVPGLAEEYEARYRSDSF